MGKEVKIWNYLHYTVHESYEIWDFYILSRDPMILLHSLPLVGGL